MMNNQSNTTQQDAQKEAPTQTRKRLFISFIVAIILSIVIGVLLYFHTVNNGGELRWPTLISNTCLIIGAGYLLVLIFTLLSRAGVLGHLVYAIRKLRKRSVFAQKYKSYPQYLAEHKVSNYRLIIYWLPAVVFLAAAVIAALFA